MKMVSSKDYSNMNQDVTLKEFSLALSSQAPTPGGGGAASYVAALAAALGSMVIALSKNKSKFANYQDDYAVLSLELERLNNDLLASIHQDEVAFLPLAKAYALDKNDPNRDEILEKCLLDAANAPLDVLRTTCCVVDCLARLKPISSRLVISDVASGAGIAYGAILASSINVRVNTRLMKDLDVAFKLNDEVEKLESEYTAKSLKLFNEIEKEMAQ